MTFRILTLGCKLNCCDSAAIEKALISDGYSKADENDFADVFIVNSCAVTATAVAKSRHALSKAKRDNAKCVTVLCGCFPQSYPEEAGLKSGADIVLGNSNKAALPDLLREYFKRPVRTIKVEPMTSEYSECAPDEDRTRAFIKAQDGCNRFCTYCIIPKARGRVRSLPLDKLEEQCRDCVENGHREIVLTGINLGCYGQDLGLTLIDAVKAAERSGAERIRLSSLEPELVTDELISGLQSVETLCPHFHLSLQSGSTAVLKRMARMYTAEQYREVARKLRSAFPECSITTDIIAGFPEETDEEFAETVEFAREIGFAKIHVFPYSRREGTVAAEMPQIHPRIRSARVDILTEVGKELELAIFKSQVGKTRSVLIEKPQSEEYSHGFTENYLPVRIYGKPLPRHSLVNVIITGYREGYCTGRVID
ncbi:MAG: tRNA (N(6)-L-threonylcarbamoyladenosine(37)-C(2))-methylthiotransferase MtaB [Oscillospiraceae bacterium]